MPQSISENDNNPLGPWYVANQHFLSDLLFQKITQTPSIENGLEGSDKAGVRGNNYCPKSKPCP